MNMQTQNFLSSRDIRIKLDNMPQLKLTFQTDFPLKVRTKIHI